MREFIRLALRFGMILILVGGCAHNLYHFQKFTDKPYNYNRYHPTYGASSNPYEDEVINVPNSEEEEYTNNY